MSTKANYKLNEIGLGKVGFSKTRSIIEAAFYGNMKSSVCRKMQKYCYLTTEL